MHFIFRSTILIASIALLVSCKSNNAKICDLYFVVLDAKTHEKVSNYTFEFPASNGNSISGCVQYRKDNYGIFYAPSLVPVSVTISAPGYSEETVTLQPKSGTTSGSIPAPKEILITKNIQTEQDAAANP
jgi:hypothetical protein